MFEDYKDLDFKQIGVKIPEAPIEDEIYEELKIKKGDSSELLKALCRKGFKEKLEKFPYIKEKKQIYVDQLIHELDIYEKTLFTDYLLLNWWIVRWCRKKGIMVNPRGSAASSLVLYCLGISRVDPIKHELIFERFLSADRIQFLSPGRIDPDNIGDIDLDSNPEGRDELIEYLKGTFENRFCKVITMMKFSSPLLLKELCKIGLEYEVKQSEIISKAIPKPHGKALSVKNAKESVLVVTNLFKNEPDIEYFAGLLEDLICATGSHPSAYLTMAEDIDNCLPVEHNKEGELLSSWDMIDAQSEHIKVDLLSVRSLTLINEVCKEEGIDPEMINYEDQFIYDRLKDFQHEFGIFQLSAQINHGVSLKIKPDDIDELTAVLAIARPGALNYLDDYIDNKKETSDEA